MDVLRNHPEKMQVFRPPCDFKVKKAMELELVCKKEDCLVKGSKIPWQMMDGYDI